MVGKPLQHHYNGRKNLAVLRSELPRTIDSHRILVQHYRLVCLCNATAGISSAGFDDTFEQMDTTVPAYYSTVVTETMFDPFVSTVLYLGRTSKLYIVSSTMDRSCILSVLALILSIGILSPTRQCSQATFSWVP
jgi:hypothetical protein